MNSRRYSLLLASLLLAAVSPARAEVVKENAGWYSVDIPLPTERTDEFQDTEIGKLRIYMLSHDGGDKAYNVTYTDYPDGLLSAKDPSTLYDAMIKAQIQAMHGVIRSMVPCSVGPITGRDVIVDMQGEPAVVHLRCFIVGDRVIQVVYAGGKATEASPATLKFLDSFKLLHIPKSAKPATLR